MKRAYESWRSISICRFIADLRHPAANDDGAYRDRQIADGRVDSAKVQLESDIVYVTKEKFAPPQK
jgi:hypothetical protein